MVASRLTCKDNECDEWQQNYLVLNGSVMNKLVIKQRYFLAIFLITDYFIRDQRVWGS